MTVDERIATALERLAAAWERQAAAGEAMVQHAGRSANAQVEATELQKQLAGTSAQLEKALTQSLNQ